ncbi:MAG: heparinase II/III family protein [Verrucomicrobiota bacterium]
MREDDLAGKLGSIGTRRPRFLFTPERLERLRARLSKSARERERWEQLRKRGREVLELPWPAETTPESADEHYVNHRQPAQHLAEVVRTLGLLHLIEPDERYAKKIRDGLLYYADDYAPYRQWCAPLFRIRQPAWHSELMTASLCFSYAAGHEILHDWLAPSDREHLAETLIARGVLPLLQDWLLPGTRLHCLDTMGHNWWIVCHSMAGIGALAMVGIHPEAASWVSRIEGAIPLWFGYGGSVLHNKAGNFDSGGGYFEGVHYANYALMEYLLFRTALRDVLPDHVAEDCAELRLVPRFLLHTLYPAKSGSLAVNFGDARHNSAATMTMRLLMAHDLAGEYGAWYVEHSARDESEPMAMLFGSDQAVKTPTALPTSTLFPEASWAVLRSGWEVDATLLAVRAGAFWIHAHADSGSFMLFHHGRPLIIDAGHCEYFQPEYTEYYAASRGHNVVLVNGEGAPREDFVRGSKFPGKVHSLLDEDGLKYVYADATGPIAHLVKRHYRHWVWAEGAIVIFDDLLAHEPSCFNWLLHYGGTATWDARSASIRHEGTGADVQFLHPAKLEVRAVDAPAQDTTARQVSYLEFSTTAKERRMNFLTVVIPQDQTVPRIERIDDPDFLGLRIIGTTLSTDLYFNLQADGRDSCNNPHMRLEGWETDACLLAATRRTDSPPGERLKPHRLLMIDGSYLRRDGEVWLDSLSRVDCLAALEPQRLRISIHGQREIDLICRAETRPGEVLINGSAHAFEYLDKEKLVRCHIARSSGQT